MNGIKVLSLFDGIGCGRVALDRAQIPVKKYVAYEIDPFARKTCRKNNRDVEQYADVFRGDYTRFRGSDLLVGGSPCTYWSIARNGRETTSDGIGYQLFMQYVRALRESGAARFIYENNFSIHKNIKDAISAELGVSPIVINSNLVSAQNRERCYWTNIPHIELPEDRNVVISNILESGEPVPGSEKSYCLTATYGKAVIENSLKHRQRTMIEEYVETPCVLHYVRTDEGKRLRKAYEAGELHHKFNEHRVLLPREDGKANTVTTNQFDNLILETAERCGAEKIVYRVENGLITIKGKTYPVKLSDGNYTIRKMRPLECERLQTLPDNYTAGVSDSQRYKQIGNCWTVDIIAHLMRYL